MLKSLGLYDFGNSLHDLSANELKRYFKTILRDFYLLNHCGLDQRSEQMHTA